MRKVLIWIVVVAILGGAGYGAYWFIQQRQAEQMVYEVLRSETVTTGDLAVVVTASGSVAVNERTDVLIQRPGTVASVEVDVNQRAEAGQVLARMDTRDLERSIEQSEIALELAKLNLEAVKETADPEDIEVAELALSSAGKALQVARLNTRVAEVDANEIKVQAQRAREQAYIRLRDARDAGEGEDRAQTAYEQAESEERAAGLNAQAALQQADSQLRAAITSYEQAERALNTLREGPDEDQIRQQELLVEQAELRLEQIRRTLNDAALTAPHAGIVAAVSIERGTYVSAGTRAFTLIDDSRTYVDVTIDEIDIGAIELNQSVTVVLDAYPELTLNGIVETIAPASTNVGGLVAYEVRIQLQPLPVGPAIDSPLPRVLEGMTANVQINTETLTDLLLIPNWALRIDQEAAETYTYALSDGAPMRRVLELGRRNEEFSEVISGVEAGETVALVLEERVPFDFFSIGGPPSGGGFGGF